jgi:GNAT superfamily N-acetyltransferase
MPPAVCRSNLGAARRANVLARLVARFSCWLTDRQTTPPTDPDAVHTTELPPPPAALIDDNPSELLWPQFRRYGPGMPGLTQETASDWVIRSDLGCVVGGARVHVEALPEPLVSIDVAIAPRHRRRGYATRLYEALVAAGIDVEAGSDTSLRYGTMTKLGYAFMVGRRAKKARLAEDEGSPAEAR